MKRKAVFLDRDGVINREVGVLSDVTRLRLLPGVAGAIRKLNQQGFLVVIVTNQPVVARGWLDEEGVKEMNNLLLKRLEKKGAKIDAVYYCPHHPEATLEQYRKRCLCRKPEAGMVFKATQDLNIDLEKSFMVGDMSQDVLAGERAGLKTVLVRTGYAGKDAKYNAKPNFVSKNLVEAVNHITRGDYG